MAASGGGLMRMGLIAVALVLTAQALAAETVVRLDRPVPDADFHRAVACGAKPGGACRHPLVHWGRKARRDLRIALLPPDPAFSAAKARLVEAALDRAIAEINAVGADLRLRKVAPGAMAHVRVRMSGLREGQKTRGVAGFPDGVTLGAASFQIYWGDNRLLERAAILVAADIAWRDIESVVLEEVVQSLGLMADIEGAAYAGRSIFDQNSNSVTRLTGQDAAAIRQHYPPK